MIISLIVWGGGLFFCGLFLLGFVDNILFWRFALRYPSPQIIRGKVTFFYCIYLYLDTIFGYFVAVLLRCFGWIFFVRQYFIGEQERFEKSQISQVGGQCVQTWATQDQGQSFKDVCTKAPVLCVHGIYESERVWLPIRKVLIQQGFFTATFGYMSFFVPFETIVNNFEQAITALEKKYPQQKPFIVAHSLGGIITRVWMQRNNNGARLAGVITLATPHKGSVLARLALGSLIKNIVPHSTLLRELAAHSAPPACGCVSLFTATDEAVLPSSSLLPPNMWKSRLIAPCSHFGMLIRKHSIEALVEELYLIQEAHKSISEKF